LDDGIPQGWLAWTGDFGGAIGDGMGFGAR